MLFSSEKSFLFSFTRALMCTSYYYTRRPPTGLKRTRSLRENSLVRTYPKIISPGYIFRKRMRTAFIRTAKSRCWITLILVFSRFRVCLAKKKKNENIFSTRCMWGTTRQQYERTHLHISVSACARAHTNRVYLYCNNAVPAEIHFAQGPPPQSRKRRLSFNIFSHIRRGLLPN